MGYTESMSKDIVTSRLKELGIYNDYYYRLEIKPLSNLLNCDETLNCVLTGVMDGCRRMVAVTDYRILIISAQVASNGEVMRIRRSAVKSWRFNRKFLLSSIDIETEDQVFHIKQTQAAREDLFNKAMALPIKEFDE